MQISVRDNHPQKHDLTSHFGAGAKSSIEASTSRSCGVPLSFAKFEN